MAKTIYLDNGATTALDPKVDETIKNAPYGNPASTHSIGIEAKRALEEARHVIAKSIKAKDNEIIFTSGGTESNNLAIKGLAFADNKKHIITTKIEHNCVLNACKWLETQEFKVTYLDTDKEGFISLEELEKAITEDTFLVSIIHGNNEIGTIQDLKQIYNICKKHNVIFHTDACQSYTKTDLSAKHADLITLNAHKIHGPKGVGALYIRKGIKITPLAHGGNHEEGLRSGTVNVPGIVGFAKAVQIAKKRHVRYMAKLRDYMIKEILKIPKTQLNGPEKNRLCNNINISFRYIEGESLGSFLDAKGICTSTGSACSSHSLEPSHVLMALEDNHERAHGSIRFTLSKYTKKEDIDYTLAEIKKTVKKLRRLSPLARV
ncbi:aminotransferase class V-fold PLP-dependent enzyme [Candidatus Woesearchaeota archaeon]|nr:aminotransferase class V-fold PLP-dependent enzyme [Candidatus Woesearchaeota archaeon]